MRMNIETSTVGTKKCPDSRTLYIYRVDSVIDYKEFINCGKS